MGFTLGVENAPYPATCWGCYCNYDSTGQPNSVQEQPTKPYGALLLGEKWICADPAPGENWIDIMCLDSELYPVKECNVSVTILDDRDYIFDFATETLRDVTPAEEVAGEISHIWMWYEPLETWGLVWHRTEPGIVEYGPEIPLNGDIYISPYVYNRSDVTIVLHVDLEVTYPDGTRHTLSAVSLWEGVPSGQDEERAPNEGGSVSFEPFIASQEGTYTVKATLSSGGQVLDSVTFELVVAAVAEYEGTLSRMELEYDETWASIPVVDDIPQDKRGIVHIWGRNDALVAQRMGIYWFVADPEGYVAQEYGPYWELWPYTGAGKEHGFLSGRFDLDKVGKYTMWVELLMNPDNPEVVDRYIGDLCTVAAVVPEPDFAGFGITEYTK